MMSGQILLGLCSVWLLIYVINQAKDWWKQRQECRESQSLEEQDLLKHERERNNVEKEVLETTRSKILVIGIGGGGENAVKRMKEVGIANARFITFGDFMPLHAEIEHYNLITLSGRGSLPAGADVKEWRQVAEDAKDKIAQIIESHFGCKSEGL